MPPFAPAGKPPTSPLIRFVVAKLEWELNDHCHSSLHKVAGDEWHRAKFHYHDGVGADGDLVTKLLGGAVGLGLTKIIQDAYGFVVADYEPGDEIYIRGFSRGAHEARALAGLIGASGIQRGEDQQEFDHAD